MRMSAVCDAKRMGATARSRVTYGACAGQPVDAGSLADRSASTERQWRALTQVVRRALSSAIAQDVWEPEARQSPLMNTLMKFASEAQARQPGDGLRAQPAGQEAMRSSRQLQRAQEAALSIAHHVRVLAAHRVAASQAAMMRAPSGISSPARPSGIAAAVPALVARRGRAGATGRMLSAAREDALAGDGCWRMIAHSSASSGPGLRRIASGTATLPTSRSSAARHEDVELLGVEPEAAPDGGRELRDAADVLVEAGLALGQHLDSTSRACPRAAAAAAALARVHALVGAPQASAASRPRRGARRGRSEAPIAKPVAVLAERRDGALRRAARRRRARRRAAGRTRRRRAGRRGRRPTARARGARRCSSASPAGWPNASL